MADFEPGSHELLINDLIKLIQQYDSFSITCGIGSFLQIRVPTRWVKAEADTQGIGYITCRNKRKRDGHLFKICGNKFTLNVLNAVEADGRLEGTLSSGNSAIAFFVTMTKDKEANDAIS